VRKLLTSTAVIASLLVGNAAHAANISKMSDDTKIATLAGIMVHADMCGKPQSANVQSIRDQLKDDDDISMGDVRVKAADYAVEAALDNGAWCAKANKIIAGLDKPDTPTPAATPSGSVSIPVAPALATTKDGMPDYKDKGYTCDKAEIERGMASLIEESPAGAAYGLRLLYVKGDPVETLRVTEELRCRVTVKTNRSTMKGIFRYHVEDGHSLIGWVSGKTK
jgi:hypothetical protein